MEQYRSLGGRRLTSTGWNAINRRGWAHRAAQQGSGHGRGVDGVMRVVAKQSWG